MGAVKLSALGTGTWDQNIEALCMQRIWDPDIEAFCYAKNMKP